jgi:hypothetical protein
MTKWPTSRWNQGWIAFAVAVPTACVAFKYAENHEFQRMVREQVPYNPQNDLSAFVGALSTAAFTLVGVFVGLYIVQRVVTAILRVEKATNAN